MCIAVSVPEVDNFFVAFFEGADWWTCMASFPT